MTKAWELSCVSLEYLQDFLALQAVLGRLSFPVYKKYTIIINHRYMIREG